LDEITAMSAFVFAQDIISAVTLEECQRLTDLARGSVVLEVGSWLGRSTVALASVARSLHAVDWHQGDHHAGFQNTLDAFLGNLTRYKMRDKLVIHLGKIEDVAPILNDGAFDVVFLDAFHSQEAVERDILLLKHKVKSGGALAFHDYGRERCYGGIPFGVTQAVDAFVKRAGLAMEVTGTLAVVRM
jgi:predicted O-methyltransferase YrrM